VTAPYTLPDAETRAELRAIAERRLSREEFEAALQIPISETERAEMNALIDWFTRRYPTPLARLEYVRRAYARWTRKGSDSR
jgi:hypothetical protein